MSNSGLILPHSSMETHRIIRIEFGLLNPEEIKNMAVVKIELSQVTDQTTGNPIDNGINDLRMGTVDKLLRCRTCECNFADCPGHFGFIELIKPMYHIGFIETCRKILRCVCFNCSKLLTSQTDNKFKEARGIKNPKRRQNVMFKLCSTQKKCRSSNERRDDQSDDTSSNAHISHGGCDFIQPKYRKDKDDPLKIIVEFDAKQDDIIEKKRNLTAEECLRIFKKITAEDCESLGFEPARARPDWMIITLLPVCPPQVRPSVAVDATLRSEDDLTFQYNQILKANIQLKKQEEKGAASHLIQETAVLLQFYIATLMNNEISSGRSQQRSGRPIKAISTRLKGKEGRLRGNLMGKRVDFSARTVITPDPNLSLDELGVPLSIALNLTFPEVVTPMNIDYLRKLVENGPTEWPGAKYIVRDDGVRIDLRYLKKRADVHLDCGYIVERHMQNGDWVLFNRQPSLHKMSIMGHKVRVLPYSTFRLNLSVTTPYNADFDGDEMNMHLPQSLETKAEIMEIMHVPKQIVSPQSNKPVMGIVQDSLIGVKLFTHRDVFVELEFVMNLVMWISDFDGQIPVPAILKPKPLWSGKQLFSLILPQINLLRFTSSHEERFDGPICISDTRVLIEKGELIMGILCKRTVGNAGGGLVHCIWNEWGPERTTKFLNNCQRLVNNWLVINGFTVGISDTVSDDTINNQIANTLKIAKEKVKKILVQAQEGKLERQPGKSMLESFEKKVNETLNSATDSAGKLVQGSLSPRNHIKNMVIAGSKGSYINISQIIACVGQQNVEGKRIPFCFNKRTLPHFTKDDFGPESRGFVENSYLSGLTPQEFFFHAMGGREGIIDTAVKTSETGYIQRRLVKALEDVMIKYDGTVRNSLGHIIQFIYGEDGMSGELVEDQKIETLLMKNSELVKRYKFFDDSLTETEQAIKLEKYMEKEKIENMFFSGIFPQIHIKLEEEFQNILKDREEMREFIFKKTYDDKQHFPVNIPRIILNAKKKFSINNQTKSDLDPEYVLEKVKNLKASLVLVKGNDSISIEAQANSTKLIYIMLNYNLSCKNLIQTERITKSALDWLLGEIESRFNQAINKPGDMVGSIAAQSIGEPATQMTLNTFHFAGVSSKNVTLGVPRLKEVINVAKKLKTPSMTIYLKKEIGNDYDSVKTLQPEIEHTTMMNVTLNTEIYYDPNPSSTIIEEDKEIVDLHNQVMQEEENNFDKLSPWILRIELDQKSLTEKHLTMDDITSKIESKYPDVEILSSDINKEKLIIRLRMIFNDTKTTKEVNDSEEILKHLENLILKEISLKGIPQIKKVYVKEVNKPSFSPTTGEFLLSQNKEWVIETDGTNLYEVFLNDKVDFKRTISNDIIEIYNCLGIEAVRGALLNELRSVLKPYDVYVNYRHAAILCDVMTQRGLLTSITRHGINRVELGPLRKCSFEETVEILLEAGLFSETDNLAGITENIMMGQLAPFGTGSFDLHLDMQKIANAKYTHNSMFQDKLIDDQNLLQTPIDCHDISNTPYIGLTPNASGASTYGGFTPISTNKMSPSFTPSINPRSPVYNFGVKPGRDYITTPNPMVSPNSINSPNYYPLQIDYAKTPYSPIIDIEDSNINSSNHNKQNSAYSSSSSNNIYSPSESIPSRTNYMPHTSAYNLSNSVHQSSSPTYSPTSPNNTGSSPRYMTGKSPGYNFPSSNNPSYSPTTPIYRSSQSPDYSNNMISNRGSNYTGGSSPKGNDSVSSHSSLQYSPRSSTYNPKSPSYNIITGQSVSSPYYNQSQNIASNKFPNKNYIIEEDEADEDMN